MIVNADTRKMIEELVYQADVLSEYGAHLKRGVQAQGYAIDDTQIINLLRLTVELKYLAKYCEPEVLIQDVEGKEKKPEERERHTLLYRQKLRHEEMLTGSILDAVEPSDE